MMDDTCTRWAIAPWCTIVFLSHFCVGANCVHSRAKTNSDNHLNRMMYDRSLEDKSSDDLECPANTVVVIPVLSVSTTTSWVCPRDLLHRRSIWIKDDAALFYTRTHCSCHMVFLSSTRDKSQIPRLLKRCTWRQLCAIRKPGVESKLYAVTV